MKALFDQLSKKTSKATTRLYSTSFSLGIFLLDKSIHQPIYGIYGWVRIADEIVDSFHDYNKAKLFLNFRQDTYQAIEEKISTNPVLNSFQAVVHQYNIEPYLIETFLKSMEMDLKNKDYCQNSYEEYILGSAEVVGLMCLKVFTNGDNEQYEFLKPQAMRLGAAFQKVNFLRDINADFLEMGRSYFPEIDLKNFSNEQKQKIEEEIRADFEEALKGIRGLPKVAKLGVYAAYLYYLALFNKIKSKPARSLFHQRVRVPNWQKLFLTCFSFLKLRLNLV